MLEFKEKKLFNAGKIVDETHLFFSSIDFNAMYDCNLLTGKTSLVCSFPDVAEDEKNIHSTCVEVDRYLYFFPAGNSKYIHIYGIDDKKIKTCDVGKERYLLNSACVVGHSIYYFSCDEKSCLRLCVFNRTMGTSKTIYKIDFSEIEEKICVKRVAVCCETIIFSIYGTDSIYFINLVNMTMHKMTTDKRIFGVYCAADKIYFTGYDSPQIFEISNNRNYYKVVFDKTSEGHKGVINIIAQVGEYVVALLSNSKEMLMLDNNEFKYVRLFENCNFIYREKKNFYQFDLFRDDMVLFPHNTDYLVIVNMQKKESEIKNIDFDTNAKEYMAQILKKRLTNNIIYEEKWNSMYWYILNILMT